MTRGAVPQPGSRRAAIDAYLARCSQSEDAFVETDRPARRLPKPAAFLLLHVKQAFWTVRRAIGLDPARRKPRPPRASEAKFLLPVPYPAAQKTPRVLIDVTYAARSRLATGIQRVVREIAREAVESGTGWPVAIDRGGFSSPYADHGPGTIESGDTLLLLDASWNRLEHILPLVRSVKARGGRVVTCIYDVIPLIYPAACVAPHAQAFRAWVDALLPLSDAILTISGAVADDIRRMGLAPQKPIAVFPLSCDLAAASRRAPRAATRKAFTGGPTFLSVGTIEPRKGYAIALDAFETLWSRGSPARYVILGRRGWRMAHFERRLSGHAEYGRRLFWLNEAGDGDLAYAYAQARALIAPSVAEGFGLPIVEAARAGLPVLLSDIAVFREVGQYARCAFFDVADAGDLARQIEAAIADPSAAFAQAPQRIPTWRDAALAAMAMVRSPRLYEAAGAILTPADF